VELDFADVVLWRDAEPGAGDLERDEQALRLLTSEPAWYDGADGAGYGLR
jgi:hypothetical protein